MSPTSMPGACKEESLKLGRAREPEFLPAVSSLPRAVPGKSRAGAVRKEGNTRKGEKE